MRNYFYNGRLKLNTIKTVCCVFNLTNGLAEYELNITTMGETILLDKTPKYLGITVDRTLSYHQHLRDTATKVSKPFNLLKKLARNHWVADVTTLHTTTLVLCFPFAKYCCSIWS